MTRGTSERLSLRETVGRAVRLYFSAFSRVDPAADREAGPFAQRFQRWALAITAVVGAGIGIAQFLSPPPFSMAMVTGTYQWSSQRLPDGSIVRARPGTNLTVRLDDDARRIDVLRGEAFFEVAHESPSRPFTVYAGSTETRAVGTQFRVTHGPPGNVKVAVLQGQVRFKNIRPNGAVEERPLTAGQGASVSNGQMDTFPASDDRHVFWDENTLHMSGATIGEVVAELSLRESKRIVIDDPRVAATRLPPSTYVAPYTLDGFLSLIEEGQLDIGVRRADEAVHLRFEPSSVPPRKTD